MQKFHGLLLAIYALEAIVQIQNSLYKFQMRCHCMVYG